MQAADQELVGRLLARDESAFALLVNEYHGQLLRLARYFVPSEAIAEEVVQETWLAVLKGLPRFEGRSSLKTWIFKIVSNRAKTRGAREGRQVPFSSLPTKDDDGLRPEDFDSRGHWAVAVRRVSPQDILEDKEMGAFLTTAIEALPANQAAVLTLRDIEGCSAQEICEVLDVSEGNQRVLLHRARGRLRKAVVDYLEAQSSQAQTSATAASQGVSP